MLLSTVPHNSLHTGVKTPTGRSFTPSSARLGHWESWNEMGEIMFSCSPSKHHYLFKRFGNIAIIAGAGIGIREESDCVTCTSGRLWQVSSFPMLWPHELQIWSLYLSIFSQSLSPPYVSFFWWCDASEVKPSVDGLSESRTVGGESNLHVSCHLFVWKGGNGILAGMVLLSHSFIALSVSFL